jgi:predicted negative regulator of RcsB-dependent stress response
MEDGVKWVGSVVVLTVLGVAGYFAYQRGREDEAKSEALAQANDMLVALAGCVTSLHGT